jgi:hypothetical protein
VGGQIYKIDQLVKDAVTEKSGSIAKKRPSFNASTKVQCKEKLKKDVSKFFSINKTPFESKSGLKGLSQNSNNIIKCQGKLCPCKISDISIRDHLVKGENCIAPNIPLYIPYHVLQVGDIKGF